MWGGHATVSNAVVVFNATHSIIQDPDYHEESGYVQEQEEYQLTDLVNGEIVVFTNVVDKGYRVRAFNFRYGKQLTAQPVFAKSDQQFKGLETLFSASIAADRGGNERGVDVSKRCCYCKLSEFSYHGWMLVH